ncbi:MAG TPA: hypothetical protein VGF81_11765 [Solirubrobacteraceae bacterium]|jgi:hypothetical protein
MPSRLLSFVLLPIVPWRRPCCQAPGAAPLASARAAAGQLQTIETFERALANGQNAAGRSS